MTVNYYFQNGVPESYSANQNLVEALIIQAIQIGGMDTYYVPRTLIPGDIDPIFTEDALAKYDNAYRLEMYLENAQGFEGDGALMSKLGIQISDSCTFVVARSRWEAEVGRSGNTMLARPCEGDIVYLPLTKSYFEIKQVIATNPFYQLGKLFVYRLECELFEFSHEVFDTGLEEIDSLSNEISLAYEDHYIMTETGNYLCAEDGTHIIQEYTDDMIDPAANNGAFAAQEDDVLVFNENNPFGDIVDAG
jgi:hypothetical protein